MSPISLKKRSTEFLDIIDPKLAFLVPHDKFPTVNDPEFVDGASADFMRPDDWIIGVLFDKEARCYPEWMLDNYHVVNDTIDGLHVAVMHCEICSSCVAYLADHEGMRLTSGITGLFGGTMAFYDEQTDSDWSHGMGTAFAGRLKGVTLPLIQSFQGSWKEWFELFPSTKVMVWPEPKTHPDGRHGHGVVDTFAKEGMDPLAVRTMNAGNDPRLAENEMVVSINLEKEQAVIPLQSINVLGVIQNEIAGLKLVTISHGRASAMVGTYHRHLLDDETTELEFEMKDGNVVDLQTGSIWRMDGLAIEGPLAGKRLEPLPTMLSKWHSLACFLPGVKIITPEKKEKLIWEDGELGLIIIAYQEKDYQVSVDHQMYSLELPHGCQKGFQLHINGDPFQFLIFEDETLAEDHCICKEYCIQEVRGVIQSNPRMFSDDLNSKQIERDKRDWSKLIYEPSFHEAFSEAALPGNGTALHPRPNLKEFYMNLKANNIEIHPQFPCHQGTLPVRALFGVHFKIEKDPFIIYRFSSQEQAIMNNPEPEHSIMVGHFLIRSDPRNIYADEGRETDRNQDERVSWSKLLDHPQFLQACESAFHDGPRNP